MRPWFVLVALASLAPSVACDGTIEYGGDAGDSTFVDGGDAHGGDGAAGGDSLSGGDDTTSGDSTSSGDSTATGDTTLAGDTVLVGPCPIPSVEVTDVTVQQLEAAIDAGDNLAVVDVRSVSETNGGYIEGALLHVWSGGVLTPSHDTLPTDKPLYIICNSGNRSRAASAYLVDNGHFCVNNVLGGIQAWKNAGYPVYVP